MITWTEIGMWYLIGLVTSFLVCLIVLFVSWLRGEDIVVESLKGAFFFIILSWLGVIIEFVIATHCFVNWLENADQRVVIKGRPKYILKDGTGVSIKEFKETVAEQAKEAGL